MSSAGIGSSTFFRMWLQESLDTGVIIRAGTRLIHLTWFCWTQMRPQKHGALEAKQIPRSRASWVVAIIVACGIRVGWGLQTEGNGKQVSSLFLYYLIILNSTALFPRTWTVEKWSNNFFSYMKKLYFQPSRKRELNRKGKCLSRIHCLSLHTWDPSSPIFFKWHVNNQFAPVGVAYWYIWSFNTLYACLCSSHMARHTGLLLTLSCGNE